MEEAAMPNFCFASSSRAAVCFGLPTAVTEGRKQTAGNVSPKGMRNNSPRSAPSVSSQFPDKRKSIERRKRNALPFLLEEQRERILRKTKR